MKPILYEARSSAIGDNDKLEKKKEARQVARASLPAESARPTSGPVLYCTLSKYVLSPPIKNIPLIRKIN